MNAPGTGYRPAAWRAHSSLLLLWVIYSLASLDRQIMSILMEPVKKEFGASDTALGLLSGLAFAALYAGLAVPVARMADTGHRARIISVCCLIWSSATVMCGVAASMVQLFLARMGVAVGEAGAMAPGVSLVSDLYSKERRATALSILLSGGTVGALAGMGLGGWVAHTYGWRTAFIVFGIPGVLMGLLAWVAIHEPRKWQAGAAVLAGKTAPAAPAEKLPRQMLRLLGIPSFGLILSAAALMSMVGTAFAIWMPSFLVRSHGLTIAQAGLAIAVTGILTVIGGIFCGWLCDRAVARDVRWQMGMPALTVLVGVPGAVLFLLMPQGNWMLGEMPVPHALLGTMWYGFFGSGYVGMTYSALSRIVQPNERGVAVSIVNLASVLVGMGLGPLFAGGLSDILLPRFGAEGLRWSLMVLVCLFPVAAALYFLALKPFTRRVTELEGAVASGAPGAGAPAGYRPA